MFRAYRFVGKLNGKYAEQQRRLITGAFQFIILSCEWFDVDAAELMANSTDLKTIWNWKKKKEKRCQDSRCCFKINFHDREMIVTEGANIKLSPFILFRTIHDRNKEGQSIFTFSHSKKKTKYPGHECCHVRVVKSSGSWILHSGYLAAELRHQVHTYTWQTQSGWRSDVSHDV